MHKLYELSQNKESLLKENIKIKDYYLHYKNFEVSHAQSESFEVVLLGEVIDINFPELTIDDITKNLATFKDFSVILDKSKYLLGRFVIFIFEENGSFKIISDCVSSIPVNYYINDNIIALSSDTYFLAKQYGLSKSEESVRIKSETEDQHPLPYNITMYNKIKVLIPNHYFDSEKKEMIRFYPNKEIESSNFDFVVSETIRVIDRVKNKIVEKNKLSLPITSGIDSRTILAFFKEYVQDIPLYTFYDRDDEKNWDVIIPQKISKAFNLEYFTFQRLPIVEENLERLRTIMDGNENVKILKNGFTLSESELKDRRFLAGDIIPIAKSNFGKNLPESMATSSYLITKTHNYSKENKKFVKNWMNEAENDYGVSLFDLFFLEYRFGRWLPKNAQNYDLFISPFYIFNCRYLVELWLSVSREERTTNSIHEEIIRQKWPELLDFPINPGKSKINKIFSNPYIFYLGSYGKYFINKFR